jgi:MYXO-CTERM domain-containing protein
VGAVRGALQWGGRLAVAALVTGALGATGSGTAVAAPDDGLTPFVECISRHADGSWTAVLGYENTGRTAVDVPAGARNKITPDRDGTTPPTTFEPGRHRGAFSVTVRRGAGVVWHLGDDNLRVRITSGPACPPPTDMPADGNGTGPAVALAAAGVAGAVLLRRRRRTGEADAPAGSGSAGAGAPDA